MTTYTHIRRRALVALGLITLMLAPGRALSNDLFAACTPEAFPCDEGDFGRTPTAAASLALLDCRSAGGGYYFTFEVEVEASAWHPVYALKIVPLRGTSLEPVECPEGWHAAAFPAAFDASAASLTFRTSSDPITQGSTLRGFKVWSSSNRAVLKWYVTDSQGVMLGKMSRTVFNCSATAVPATWGSVKALYR